MKQTGELLLRLRKLMQNLPNNMGSISAYIVPSDDAHQSEYLAEKDMRRAFVSGFDGSAGTVVVTDKDALLWTDGRYYLQAEKQLDTNWKLMKNDLPTTLTIDAWLAKNLSKGDKVGVDGNLMSTRKWENLIKSLKPAGCTLLNITQNLVDLIWENKPAFPTNKIIPLSIEYNGKLVCDKLAEVREKMVEKKASVLVVTALDEVACKYYL